MSQPPGIHKVSEWLAVPEERMETRQAEYRTDIANLAKSMTERSTTSTTTIIGAVAFLRSQGRNGCS